MYVRALVCVDLVKVTFSKICLFVKIEPEQSIHVPAYILNCLLIIIL